MDFEIRLERINSIVHNFRDGNHEPYDLAEDEPSVICGNICIEDESIGSIRLYELCNDKNFFSLLDSVDEDCSIIARVICGKSGAVLKKYLSGESEYDPVYILDQIAIDREFRNRGIGSVIIKNLLKMINYQFGRGSTVFLCASDYESAEQYGFESSEYEEGKNRLIEFYKKLGFRIVKDNIMVYTEKDT